MCRFIGSRIPDILCLNCRTFCSSLSDLCRGRFRAKVYRYAAGNSSPRLCTFLACRRISCRTGLTARTRCPCRSAHAEVLCKGFARIGSCGGCLSGGRCLRCRSLILRSPDCLQRVRDRRCLLLRRCLILAVCLKHRIQLTDNVLIVIDCAFIHSGTCTSPCACICRRLCCSLFRLLFLLTHSACNRKRKIRTIIIGNSSCIATSRDIPSQKGRRIPLRIIDIDCGTDSHALALRNTAANVHTNHRIRCSCADIAASCDCRINGGLCRIRYAVIAKRSIETDGCCLAASHGKIHAAAVHSGVRCNIAAAPDFCSLVNHSFCRIVM